MKAQTNISIDPKTFVVNLNDNKITFLMGDTEVKSLSFLYDDKGQMSSRLVDIKAKNPTMKTALTGKTGNIEWAVVYFS
jgi:hypothetical protein